MMSRVLPYLISFFGAFSLTIVLTPLVREFHRRIGMVDRPDPRRINKVPIPRGGGIALVVGVFGSYLLFHWLSGLPAMQSIPDVKFYKMVALAVVVSLIGLADDRFSLNPRVKLIGQFFVALLVWFWADMGFVDLWPRIPAWFDCAITVFWLVGAMNAFNLIDGLDGLASGIALIAVVGMAGSLFIMSNPQMTMFHIAMAGGLLAFLRYNYNPASVFLGDSGSMFIGFVVASLPLASHAPNSFMVSVGVPLLAMGVPIFDTSLAIVRRTIRRCLNPAAGKSGEVMAADSDHLHHRILRSVGLDQRKAAWVLYSMALGAVLIGLVGMTLQSRAAGLWLGALALATIVIVRDMARVELFDAGKLLNNIAHSSDNVFRRRIARLTVPITLIVDVMLLCGSFVFCVMVMGMSFSRVTLRVEMPIRVAVMFGFLVVFRTYITVWARAVASNYLRLSLACGLGAIAGSVVVYYAPHLPVNEIKGITILYGMTSFILLFGVRLVRAIVRDCFYAIDCSRLKGRKDVSRVLVYGCGIRYRSFRRELVRSVASNTRIIVGLMDDDILLRNHYIGGIRVLGTLNQAVEIINEHNVDAVVIACDISDEWLTVVKKTLIPTGVKISQFTFIEREITDE